MNKQYLAFDVGGTTIKSCVFDENFNLSYYTTVPTNKNKDETILKTLKTITHEITSKIEISGIGVSTAGIVSEDGSIKFSGPTIPNYIHTPIKEELMKQTNLPVVVINDVDSALLGEIAVNQLYEKDIYCIALGTGIGGAYYTKGKLVNGCHGMGNSIGYTLYDINSKTNYEQRASTLALEKILKNYNISVIEAFTKAREGDTFYKNIIENWSIEVAHGLASIIALFDPEYIIIGGAVSEQETFLLDILNKSVNSLLPSNFHRTILKFAQQGNQAQLIGAVSLLLQN